MKFSSAILIFGSRSMVALVVGKLFLAVCTLFWKDLVHSMAENFQTPLNKLKVNLNPIPKKHRDPHKMS